MQKKSEGISVTTKTDRLTVNITKNDTTEINFFNSINSLLKKLDKDDHFFIIDNAVAKNYKNELQVITEKRPFLVIPVRESNKSWEYLRLIIDKAIEAHISRKGAFVAIGGGVVTDMTGLASNLFFRGIKSIVVPTTLLAMVDAAVGGKVAVNHPHQKNMLGSFYHPTEILYCTEFLRTLPRRHIISAAGEMLKLSLVSKTNLFSLLKNSPEDWINNKIFLNEIINLSAKEKLILLGDNCFERNLKRPLNLGHSVAHPLEDITDFKVLHGEAVAYGVLIASNISTQRGAMSKKYYNDILTVTSRLGLTMSIKNIDRKLLWERIRRLIRQRGGKGLLYVLPTKPGYVQIVKDISQKELFTAMDTLEKESLAYSKIA